MPGRPLRLLVGGGVALVPITLVFGFGHAGAHAARSMLIPGLGLAESRPVLAAAFVLAATAATVSWLRWGTDWALVAVVVGAMAASAAWGSVDHGAGQADLVHRSAHEFPLVIAVVGALGWLRVTLGGVPGFGWIRGRQVPEDTRQTLAELGPVDRCRAVAVLGLADAIADDAVRAVDTPDVHARARRVGLVARGRWGGDPFRRDQAPTRAARCAAGLLDDDAMAQFAADARRSSAGVPASEPTWVRTFDATVAAAVLAAHGAPDVGERWAELLNGPLRPRRGHRPAWWWTPLGIAAGRSLDWEHAAATAIAHAHGWVDADEWAVLRRRVLGAAARGTRRRDDERLIAAGRCWLALVDDPEAERIVGRPTVGHDPLAVALDTYARHLAGPPPARSIALDHAGPAPVGGPRS